MASDSSRLIDFYAGRATDNRGRTIDDIWAMSLDDLEYTHDYIQWLFPLRERSSVEPETPTLDEATIAEFRAPAMQRRVVRSAETMAAFYGFRLEGDGSSWRLDLAPNAAQRQRVWVSPGNHNFLRLTRIMKSLAILGLDDLSAAWLDVLRRIYTQNPTVIGTRTWSFWTSAPAKNS
jgi:hypothetical protein